MTEPVADRAQAGSGVGIVLKALLLAGCAVAIFLAGRLWSLREAREAQRAAGLAEEQCLRLRAELIECRNALVLERGRAGDAAAARPGRQAAPSRSSLAREVAESE